MDEPAESDHDRSPGGQPGVLLPAPGITGRRTQRVRRQPGRAGGEVETVGAENDQTASAEQRAAPDVDPERVGQPAAPAPAAAGPSPSLGSADAEPDQPGPAAGETGRNPRPPQATSDAQGRPRAGDAGRISPPAAPRTARQAAAADPDADHGETDAAAAEAGRIRPPAPQAADRQTDRGETDAAAAAQARPRAGQAGQTSPPTSRGAGRPADPDVDRGEAGGHEAPATGTAGPDPAEDGDAADGDAVDGDAPAGEAGPRVRRWVGISRAALLIGVLCGLLGFGLAVQVQSNTASNGLSAARPEDLVRILDDLSSREERLRRQIASLEAARSRLTTTGDRNSAALVEAKSRSAALGVLAGTGAAQGPGIELTMSDPQHRLKAEDLLDAVEELRAAGAEAIQVGTVRIGLDSAFTDADNTDAPGAIRVDDRPLTAPYGVLAIGDPATLATALNIPGGVVDTVRQAGGRAVIVQQQRLVIRVLRSLSTPHYAQPAE